MWETVHCLDPGTKQLESKDKPARFLGIAWDHGDNLCYYVWTILTKRKERPATLIRIIARSQQEIDVLEGAADLNSLRFNENQNINT